MKNNDYMRLARVEAMVNAQRAELDEVIQNSYELACKEHNKEDAAELARKIRNRLLDRSDKEMTFDRLKLNTTSITNFLASFKEIVSNPWVKYRQALRDIPEQEGFPFNIEFPKEPE